MIFYERKMFSYKNKMQNVPMPVSLSNPDVDSVVIVDDYCILYNGVAYIKPSEKDASQTERKRKRSLYMKRYRAENKQKKLRNLPKEVVEVDVISEE